MIGRMGKVDRPIAPKEQTTTQNSWWDECDVVLVVFGDLVIGDGWKLVFKQKCYHSTFLVLEVMESMAHMNTRMVRHVGE